MEFSDLGVSKWLVRQAKAVGMKVPTPVQVNCIPEILKGRDVVGCAKTGSGKTAAFAIPILQRLAEEPYGVFCLVLTPARELAYQIAEQFTVLGKHMNVEVEVVVGGRDMLQQSLSLAKKPHIVVATPGRLAHHLKITDTCRLNKVKYLVLDEADRVLDESMADDVTAILDVLPKKRHTLLFTATIDDLLDDLESSPDKKPFVYIGESSEATVATLQQEYVLCPKLVRDCYLVYLLRELHDDTKSTVIVFTATCRNCQVLCMLFNSLGIPSVALHSLMAQNGRLSSLAKLRKSQVRVLVATDLASRGLDIPTVDVVLNSNTPASATDYIHRVGRTARAGRGGRAVTFVTQYDVDRVHSIEERVGKKLETLQMDDDGVNKLLEAVTLSRRQMEVDLDKTDFGEQRQSQKDKWAHIKPKEERKRKKDSDVVPRTREVREPKARGDKRSLSRPSKAGTRKRATEASAAPAVASASPARRTKKKIGKGAR